MDCTAFQRGNNGWSPKRQPDDPLWPNAKFSRTHRCNPSKFIRKKSISWISHYEKHKYVRTVTFSFLTSALIKMQNILRRSSVFMRCFRANFSSCSLNFCSVLVVWCILLAAAAATPMSSRFPVHADPTTHHLPRICTFNRSSSEMFNVFTYFPFTQTVLRIFRRCSANDGS